METSKQLAAQEFPNLEIHRSTMNGKPVFELETKTVLNFKSKFDEKLLCDRLTFSLGSACAFNCKYCYVESIERQHPKVHALLKELEPQGLRFEDIAIRRRNALDILFQELAMKAPRRMNPMQRAVIFTSPLVDPAPNETLAKETLAACILILTLTNWTVRILSKGPYLRRIAEALPDQYRQRVIFGVSTGTLDDAIGKAIEVRVPLVSHRLKSLHWLQDNGFRTFGMICPSLPQTDPDGFVREALHKIRADRCEHVWAEVLNVRGDSLNSTCEALAKGGFNDEAARLRGVSGVGHGEAWEQYARETFLAYTRQIGPEKLRFLQYPSKRSAAWWAEHRHEGALLLGARAGSER